MTVEQMKKEVLYYRGKEATTTEAMDLLCFREENPKADLSELISEYYCC